MQKPHAIPTPRRVRTLAISLAALLLGATFYAHNVRAEPACIAQADAPATTTPSCAR